MKKHLYLIGVLAALSFWSCREERPYRIGVSQCSDDDWRNKMNTEMMREIMFHPEASVEILSADGKSSRQIEDIRYFLDKNVDILLVAPNEADSLTPVIKEIYETGLPVIIFDRKINGEYFTAYQGADDHDIGRAAAESAVSHFGTLPEILEIYGLEGSTPAIGRHAGFHDRLQEIYDTFNISTVYGKWTYEDAYPLVKKALESNHGIDVIYAHNDRMALAAGKAARELGLSPFIIGIDAAPEIGMKAVADGEIDATFLYPTEGSRLIKTAISILKGEHYEKITIFPAHPALTKENVGVLLLQNEELKEETLHLEELKSRLDSYYEEHTAQTVVLIAAIIIIVLAFAVIFFVLRAIWSHKRHQATLAKQNRRLEEQKNELEHLNEQLNEATQSKLAFFTNVSHELRTPLTLITEPIEELGTADNLSESQRSLLKIADKNARILKRLINQILDFRKFENNRLQLNLVEVNLTDLLDDWLDSFLAVAKKRHIDIVKDFSSTDDLALAVDPQKFERVIFNLISNALKYSPDNTTITISCREEDGKVIIKVRDEGRGISTDDIGNIFDRFFRVDKVHPDGSGIGLALSKAFVEMHGGSISVESIPGKGSVFIISLPVTHVSSNVVSVDKTITEKDVNAELGKIEKAETEIDAFKPVVLVIDDNDDILNMLSRLLGEDYNVLTASNGKAGLKIAARYVPDVVVCDVMMPVMDGLECCRLLKDEISTSHIPVLMLTACTMDEQRVEGFESGADGYIAKPFNSDVLKSRIKNLIHNRKLIKNLWKGSSSPANDNEEPTRDTETLQKGVSGIDNDFYHRFLELATGKLSDPDLSVDSLASDLGLARSQFYRKIKALTNYSPVELLRHMRLKEARRLLTTTDRSVSEIGFDVGFSSAAYFSKCFHDEFGETPSQLRERLGH